MAEASNPVQADSPEARRYNRVRRWLGIADFAVGFGFLVVLLATPWSGWLRDLAYRMGSQNYSLSLLMYLLLLLVIGKLLGLSKGRISQIKQAAIKDGLISKAGKLTAEGRVYVEQRSKYEL